MGLPATWTIIAAWLTATPPTTPSPPPPPPTLIKKCPEIPVLSSYSTPPTPLFWSLFPSAPIPQQLFTPVDVFRFQTIYNQLRPTWTLHQRIVGDSALQTLLQGALPTFRQPLPSISVPNTTTALHFGEWVTDTIASWIKSGFVAGPFNSPPYPNFRINSLHAVEQHDKIRPVLNLSAPENRSYNDALNKFCLPKAVMTSARLFSYSLLRAGKNAIFSKFDQKTAYKNVPQHPSLWPLQGFRWLGKLFFDTTTTFGSTASVSQFDTFAATLQNMALSFTVGELTAIHRQLDDLIVLCKASSPACASFTESYTWLCSYLNVKLAPADDKKEKAFYNSTVGLVLGVIFDSTTLSWSIPTYKMAKYLHCIDSILQTAKCSLCQLQQLLGFLNDFSHFCDFMQVFKTPLLLFIRQFEADLHTLLPIPQAVRRDLLVWRAAILTAGQSLPISPPPSAPPFTALIFYTDAAAGVYPNMASRPDLFPPREVAAVAGSDTSSIWAVIRLVWPPSLLSTAKDHRNQDFGHKSTTLEAIGLLLPLLAFPNFCRNRHLVFLTDSHPLWSDWPSKHTASDPETSLILRCITIIAAYLQSNIHVFREKRCSTPMSTLADTYSRSDYAPTLPHLSPTYLPHHQHPALYDWLLHPTLDWTLPLRLLDNLSSLEK
jgi:hypothetical protein